MSRSVAARRWCSPRAIRPARSADRRLRARARRSGPTVARDSLVVALVDRPARRPVFRAAGAPRIRPAPRVAISPRAMVVDAGAGGASLDQMMYDEAYGKALDDGISLLGGGFGSRDNLAALDISLASGGLHAPSPRAARAPDARARARSRARAARAAIPSSTPTTDATSSPPSPRSRPSRTDPGDFRARRRRRCSASSPSRISIGGPRENSDEDSATSSTRRRPWSAWRIRPGFARDSRRTPSTPRVRVRDRVSRDADGIERNRAGRRPPPTRGATPPTTTMTTTRGFGIEERSPPRRRRRRGGHAASGTRGRRRRVSDPPARTAATFERIRQRPAASSRISRPRPRPCSRCLVECRAARRFSRLFGVARRARRNRGRRRRRRRRRRYRPRFGNPSWRLRRARWGNARRVARAKR